MNQSPTDSSISSRKDVPADAISRRAYEIWESEGRPEGSDFRHWLQAEQELTGRPENNKRTDASAPPRGTTAEARPPSGTRAGTTANGNRDVKRGSTPPFAGEKNGNTGGQNQAARRKPASAPAL